jgi:flagellar basal body-associated protein FliL
MAKQLNSKLTKKEKQQKQKRAVGFLVVLLIILGLFLFAVGNSTDMYGFAKTPNKPYVAPTPNPKKAEKSGTIKPTTAPMRSKPWWDFCTDGCNLPNWKGVTPDKNG